MVISLYWKPGPWTIDMLWAIPGLAGYLLTSLWLSAVLAPLCACFRDFHHAVQTGMRLIFFATPILWMPEQSGRLAIIAKWNPLSHFVAIVREPLLYNRLPSDSWTVVLAVNAIGLLLGVMVYAFTRRRVAHWV
jgi:ABC-type polysaccharide/polyol phosphate export permease